MTVLVMEFADKDIINDSTTNTVTYLHKSSKGISKYFWRKRYHFHFFNLEIRENFPWKIRVMRKVDVSMMSDDTTYPEDPPGPTDFL